MQNTYEAEECWLFKQKQILRKKKDAGLLQFFTSLRKTFQNTASHYKKEKISCIRILQHLHTASHYKEKEKKRHVLEWLNKQLETIFTNTFIILIKLDLIHTD